MKRSIRLRLMLYLGSLMVVVWVAIAASSLYSARKEVTELFDAHLAQSARVLQSLVSHEMSEMDKHSDYKPDIVLDFSAPGHLYEGKLAFSVVDRDGKFWFKSKDVPILSLAEQKGGFRDVMHAGEKWRVFILHDKSLAFSVEVAQSYQIRNELIMEIVTRVLGPFIIIMPLLLGIVWMATGRSLRPLQTIAEEVHHRNPNKLEAIDLREVPSEVHPLFLSLNSLLSRLEKALSRERGFTSDAAHELRTPLAGIRAQAQVAMRSNDEEEKDTALRQIIIGIDNTTHLVRQMLMLARLDPEIPKRKFARQDLAHILTEVAADVASYAAEKNVDLEVIEAAGEMLMEGQAEALSVLVRNLLDNAVRYTPGNGWVKAGVSRTAAGLLLEVTDSGPGIAEADKEHVFDRFYRGLGSGQTGSGLGLSIVQRVVDLHQGKIEFQSGSGNGQGVRVRVTFPTN